jgi:hypothetical protein
MVELDLSLLQGLLPRFLPLLKGVLQLALRRTIAAIIFQAL